ncbi:hypothetical protein ACFX14_042362 [Malus domestica]
MALAADAICTCDDDGADEISPCSRTTTVCVMDASGRLGSTLVHRLLHRGYAVHAALQTHHSMYVNLLPMYLSVIYNYLVELFLLLPPPSKCSLYVISSNPLSED